MTKTAYFGFALCAICYLFGGTTSVLLSANLPVIISDLLHKPASEAEMGDIGAYLNAGFLYGWMLGGLTLGAVSDHIGRVKAFACATILCGACTIGVFWATSWIGLLLLRFGAGFGVGGILLVSTVYQSECWKDPRRMVILGLLAMMFPVGIVLSGAVTAVFSHWRDTFLLGMLPLLGGIVSWRYLPESPSWQASSGKSDHKQASLFSPAHRRHLLLGSVLFGAVLIGLWGLFSWIPTWVQGLIGVGSDGKTERGLSMMLLGLGGILGGSLSGFLMRWLGSRKTLMLTFSGLILASGLLFLTNQSFSRIIYFELAFLSTFFGISQGALSSYIPTLFPVGIRATATGFCFNICRFFTATAVFCVGALVELLGGFSHALLTFTLSFVIALWAAFYSPETETDLS